MISDSHRIQGAIHYLKKAIVSADVQVASLLSNPFTETVPDLGLPTTLHNNTSLPFNEILITLEQHPSVLKMKEVVKGLNIHFHKYKGMTCTH